MKDLIEALTILMKYARNPNAHSATHCKHDELLVVGIETVKVTEEDKVRLDALGFFPSEEHEGAWFSFRFGSA